MWQPQMAVQVRPKFGADEYLGPSFTLGKAFVGPSFSSGKENRT
jgi:hypothetical protein